MKRDGGRVVVNEVCNGDELFSGRRRENPQNNLETRRVPDERDLNQLRFLRESESVFFPSPTDAHANSWSLDVFLFNFFFRLTYRSIYT